MSTNYPNIFSFIITSFYLVCKSFFCLFAKIDIKKNTKSKAFVVDIDSYLNRYR